MRGPSAVVGKADARLRLALGILVLQGPLRTVSESRESWMWLISVAFGVAQRLAASRTEWNKGDVPDSDEP